MLHHLALPNATVTGIGSLPFKDAGQAIEFVARYAPQIPFWPQLPRRSRAEQMVEQGLCAFADLLEKRGPQYGYVLPAEKRQQFLERVATTTTYLNESHAAGFFAFEQALAVGKFPEALAVKGHLTGPLTQVYYLSTEHRAFLKEKELYAALLRHVIHAVEWQITRLQQANLPVILFVDEPVLPLIIFGKYAVRAVYDLFETLGQVLTAIRRAGALAGLHCCFPGALPRMLALRPDILSFDAVQEFDDLLQSPQTKNFLDTGGRFAFGLIPTVGALKNWGAFELFSRWKKQWTTPLDVNVFQRQALITATCGLGLLSERQAERSFQQAHEIADYLQRDFVKSTFIRQSEQHL